MSDPFVGEVRMVGFNYAPRGWASCAGQLLPIQQNSALFALLGTTYGGNGQQTFGLPNFLSVMPIGASIGQGTPPLGLQPTLLGEVAGAENITLLSSQMPSHVHPITGGGAVTCTGSVSIPATTTAPTLSNSQPAPGATAIFGPSTDSAVGADVRIYSTATANTTLAPIPISVAGNAPVPATTGIAGGSLPVSIRNPYLGINFIIALEGVFPSRN
jgi:microcystin-dependent protein